jgi:hypothetical protein
MMGFFRSITKSKVEPTINAKTKNHAATTAATLCLHTSDSNNKVRLSL